MSVLANWDNAVKNCTNCYAFGMAMNGRGFNLDKYPFGMNGQMKTTEIQDNHYTALYWEYDARTGRRWNLDPKPQVFISDYACFGNNPIFMVDINGDVRDNYTTDKSGNIKLEEKTDDDFDVLYTKESWDDGTKDNSITVDKGIFSGKKTLSITDAKTGDKYNLDRYKITGDDKARSLFEFVAKNTNVEWGLTGTGTTQNTNMLTTIHDKDSEAGGPFFLANNYTVRYYDHSHPYNIYPSDADKSFAKDLSLKFPKAKSQILYKSKYVEYDKLGLLNIPISVPEVIITPK